jgi:hypothetical protein
MLHEKLMLDWAQSVAKPLTNGFLKNALITNGKRISGAKTRLETVQQWGTGQA